MWRCRRKGSRQLADLAAARDIPDVGLASSCPAPSARNAVSTMRSDPPRRQAFCDFPLAYISDPGMPDRRRRPAESHDPACVGKTARPRLPGVRTRCRSIFSTLGGAARVLGVPDACRIVRRPGQEPFAVGRERDGPDGAFVSVEGLQRPAVARASRSGGIIGQSGHDLLAVGRKRQCGDQLGMSGEREQLCSGHCIPQTRESWSIPTPEKTTNILPSGENLTALPSWPSGGRGNDRSSRNVVTAWYRAASAAGR